jgi:hypothetical protein
MEESSQDEDPDEALKRYYAKMREKRKKQDEKKGGKQSVLGEAKSTDKEGQDMHEGNTLDHTKLITLTSADEDKPTSPTSEGIPSSPLYTSRLGLQATEDNLDDDDDILLDFNEFTSPAASPRPLGHGSQDEDVIMEIVVPPSEGTGQATSTQVDNSNLPDEASSGSQIQPTGDAGTTSLAPPQEITSLALLQENTSILTVDVLNNIVKGGRSTSPIREHTSDLEFSNIKEQRYH